MKQIFGLLGFLILVGCQSNSTDAPSKFKTITIKSSGEMETLPDMATFHINLNCLDKSVKASKDCLVDKSNELNSRLLSFGISKDDILTTSVNLNKSYTWRNNSQVFEGYRSSTTMFVTVKDIDEIDAIYTALLENRNLELGGLSYSHSKIDSLKNEAYVNALDKSLVLSDRLLAQLPESEKEILKIGNVEITASMPDRKEARMDKQYEAVEQAASGNSSISISKGTVKVTATLFVEYQIR